MVEKQVINPPGYQGGPGGRSWSPGLKVGPWLFLSGVTPVDYDKNVNVGRGKGTSTTPGTIDPEAQWRQVLRNVKALVEVAGGSMSDVVLANIYVTDMSFYLEYEWIRREFFTEPFPVATGFEAGSLLSPDWIIEIECIAYIGD